MYKCINGVLELIPYRPPDETFENINIYTISLKTHLFFVHIAESHFFSKNLLTNASEYGIIYAEQERAVKDRGKRETK